MKLFDCIRKGIAGGGVALALTALASTAVAQEKKETAKPYPLETCIVSDEKLGEMGKPVVFTHEGREIKLCCKSCRKDFDKDPAKFIKKIEEAEKKAAAEKKAKN